jgi:hypothetical protein
MPRRIISMKMIAWLSLHTDAGVIFATAISITAAAIIFGSW